ncbi:MAG: glycosyl hydrolase family 28 protein [Bacteroidota bacterium]|nr:glycosyl hydrolase family 28 protein [Bacteroidota bacterium]
MKRRNFSKNALTAVFGATALSAAAKSDKKTAINSKKASVNIIEYGALADGKTVNTKAIQKAIDDMAAEGGGVINIPAGTFVSGCIQLKSNITLDIAPGGVLYASGNIDDFPVIKQDYELTDTHGRHLIYASRAQNVCIRGGGIIYGNGPAFWEPIIPNTWVRAKEKRVQPFLKFDYCTNFRMENVTLENSPGWTCNLYLCDYIWINRVQIKDNEYGPNNDGFDLVGCRDVVISDCHIDCSDDAICFKSTKGSRSCERIVVTNCIIRTKCAAFRIGAETWYDMKQITFSNSVVYESSRAIDIANYDGGNVEDIMVSNIVCDSNSGNPMNRLIHLELLKSRGDWGGNVAGPVGKMRRITISNISMISDGRILLTAADGGILENITLRDIFITHPWIEDPVAVKDKSDQLQASNNNPVARIARASVVVENAKNLFIDNINITWPTGKIPADFKPKYENGELLFDPVKRGDKSADFHAFWGNGIENALINIPFATASKEGMPKTVITNSKNVKEN